MTPEESNPLEDVAKAMGHPNDGARLKMLYSFMHKAMPQFGLKFPNQIRAMLADPCADAHAAEMLDRAWSLVAQSEGQPEQPRGSMRSEVRPLPDLPGRMILVWPPEAPKCVPMGHLGAICVPDEGSPRYFVLEYSQDLYDKSQPAHAMLCEWAYEPGNPNPVHKNYNFFGPAEPIDVDAFANRASMMIAHPGAKLDENILKTSTSPDGRMNIVGGRMMGGLDIKVDVPSDPSKRRDALERLLSDIRATCEQAREEGDKEDEDEPD